jgi:hypothetical protein
MALRFGFGGAKAVQSNTQFVYIKKNFDLLAEFIRHPTPMSWAGLLFCMAVPLVLWIGSNRKYLTFSQKGLVAAACAIAVISSCFTDIGEPRIFIPSTTLLIFVAVWLEANCRTRCYKPIDQ